MSDPVTIGLMPIATNFREFNMVGAIEIANGILENLQKLQVSNKIAMDLCNSMQEDEDIRCGAWMSIAWRLAYVELFERQIRVEDKQCESNGPNFNGGFNLPPVIRRHAEAQRRMEELAEPMPCDVAYEDNLVGALKPANCMRPAVNSEPMPLDPRYGQKGPLHGSPNGQ